MDYNAGYHKRSMAYYVQATQKRTRKNLSEQEIFPLPEIGDVIIFNEIFKYHDKYEGCPRVGIGTVESKIGCHVHIKEVTPRGNVFLTSLTVSELNLGLYRYVKLEKMPRLLEKSELEIDNLPEDIESLVVDRPQAFRNYVGL